MLPTTQTTTYPKKILLVDDHPLVCAFLTNLIEIEDGLEICGETGSAREAWELIKSEKPALALVDISLDSGNGLELVKRIKREYHSIMILVFSAHEEAVFAQRALDVGANGFINKRETPDKLIGAIHTVLNDGFYQSDWLKAQCDECQVPDGASPMANLSNRELEVLTLIGNGKTNSKIANLLNISVKTVEAHRENIKRKKHFKSAAELSSYAMQWTMKG